MKVKSIEELRNVSELLEFMTTEQLGLEEMRKYFVGPLVRVYEEAVGRIREEKFSVKWLDCFIEVARSVGNLSRVQQLGGAEGVKEIIVERTREALDRKSLLRRDIITQLYLILLSLNPTEPTPTDTLSLIHHLHAQSVLYSTPVLHKLLQFTTITET